MSAFQGSLPLLGLMLAAYLLGSFPTGYLMGRYLKGIDIREHGSRNPGATNVFRTVGKTAGLTTLFVDGLKGYLPVWGASKLLASQTLPLPASFSLHPLWAVSTVGLAAIAGHNWTLFLHFKGGKGVATSAGVFLALIPYPTLVAIGFFLVGFLSTQRVSVGSMLGATALCVSAWFLTGSGFLTALSIFCGLLIFYLHKKNIGRLMRGEEPKISFHV